MELNKRLFLTLKALIICGVLLANPGISLVTTYVLAPDQYPSEFKKLKPSQVYILYNGPVPDLSDRQGSLMRKDTILNYKKFKEKNPGSRGYRLLFKTENQIDSLHQYSTNYQLTDKAYNLGSGMLRIYAYDSSLKIADEFIFNYADKLKENTRSRTVGIGGKDLAWLLRQYVIYDSYDRNNYAVGSVWLLSIGIDDYGNTKYQTCKSDAQSYAEFFKSQFVSNNSSKVFNSLFHEYVLLDKTASKESITNVLKEIARKAVYNDYFIFNFSGCSNIIKNENGTGSTNFFPYDVVVESQSQEEAKLSNRNQSDKTDPIKKCISLKELQEYIQLIPANNQLFISEAGPSEKFKTEFIKSLTQNSSEVAGILNKNRIIVVPNGFGYERVNCNGKVIDKGPINYFFTSLDSSANVYDLFRDDQRAKQMARQIENKAYSCKSFDFNYFDIFFEKEFLQQYREIFGDNNDGATRGLKKERSKELQETLDNLTGKRYALIIGTDEYIGKGWNNLSNPVKDARAVADELKNSYDYEVQLLENKPLDSIYAAILRYYKVARPNDQFVIYFAGHGDVDDELLSDGFIVCNDSKSVDEDPIRNSYISYDKLKRLLNNIPARQILVLLDVCHGGTFDEKVFSGTKREGGLDNITNRNVLQFLKDKLPLRTRKFLSSVGSEPAFDGKAGKHSPFANLLLQVLRAKGSGSNGIVTLSDINAVLQTASLNETATLRISPHMADFGNVDAFSEFIFIPVERNSKE
ncbi:MAG TPA: caspase family protein [Chitinophagaceae bacterium]|nr:caspase family protein [Chitinophagaceae bacterium]